MSDSGQTRYNMRVMHRYLGFFLAGIMSIYAISGILMIFRKTDFLKKEIVSEKKLEPNLTAQELDPLLKMKIRDERIDGDLIYFKDGSYNTVTGVAKTTKKELPLLLRKMEHLHKATTNDPLFYLNIFFGVALLFFVISAFWMFLPSSSIFKKGLYFTLAGIILTLIMLFV